MLTGMYQFYTLPTTSMEPSLHVNQKILSSNLKTPKKNDIIIFVRRANDKYEPDPNGKKIVNCYRLIAKGGDTLEIINGYAYVNGQLTDDTTKLKFRYSLSSKNFYNLLTVLEMDEVTWRSKTDFINIGDEASATLSYEEYTKVKTVIPLVRRSIDQQNLPPEIYGNNKWTVDDFGPYLVPADHFFLMGDNRHNARDSRYIGPIPVKDCKGVLITKF